MATTKPTKKMEGPDVTTEIEDVDVETPDLSDRQTKKEILDAYNELVGRLKKRDAGAPRQKVEAEQKRQETVVQTAKKTSVESIVEMIGKLKLEINSGLNELAQKLTGQAEKLSEVEEAIEIESRRISELHDIELAADSLSMLLNRHEEVEAEFDGRISAKKEETARELARVKEEYLAEVARLRDEFENEISTRRAEWAREQAQHDAEWAEKIEKTKKDRAREEEEYKYRVALERKRDIDDYQARKTELEKTLADKRQTVEKELAEREAAVSTRETEAKELRERAAGFPAQLEKAVAEARNIGRAEAEREAKIRVDLKDREITGERALSKMKLDALEAKAQEQAALIKELARQIEEASNKVQNIALKSLESSSGRAALEAVNEIALEQAKKNRPT